MKVVTFDFWNTLFIDQHEPVRHDKRIQFTCDILRSYKQDIETAEVESAFARAHAQYLRQWENRLAYTMDLHVKELLTALSLQISSSHFDEIVECYESMLMERPPLIVDGAADAVREAAGRAAIGLISDTGYTPGRILRKILADHQLEQHFHAFSFSNETGYLKPNPHCFQHILQMLNARPEEAVHIGDIEETDIAGAKSIGMKAVKYIGSNPESRKESIADIVIESLNQFPTALSRLGF